LTEFETHESSNRKDPDAQSYTSNWGASASTKTLAATRFEIDWDANVRRGEKLLNSEMALAN
jgi:hypothetical protein